VSPAPTPEPISFANVEIRPGECEVLVDGRRAKLTVREFQVFSVMAAQLDRVVSREAVYKQVWGGPMSRRDRSVDVFVRKLRGKLAAVSPDYRYIHTHFGVGYRLADVPHDVPNGR